MAWTLWSSRGPSSRQTIEAPPVDIDEESADRGGLPEDPLSRRAVQALRDHLQHRLKPGPDVAGNLIEGVYEPIANTIDVLSFGGWAADRTPAVRPESRPALRLGSVILTE